MTKQHELQERMKELAALKGQPLTDEALARIRAALADRNSLVVSQAAGLVKHDSLNDLLPDIRASYLRFLQNPDKTDKLCLAKRALIEALDACGDLEEELFLRAASYTQFEPAYGGPADTAGPLRIAGCQALARIGSQDLFFILADRLADREPDVRSATAQILAGLNDERAELLLRMKVLAGDSNPTIIGECFRSLMALHPQLSLSFVTHYLEAPEVRIAEEAMVALGESRHPQAFTILAGLHARTGDPERKRVLITAISLLRSDEAVRFLLRVVAEDTPDQARAAVDALGIYRHRPNIVSQLRAAVGHRGDRQLCDRLVQVFENDGEAQVESERP
jgi:HEAT repeat protein